MPASNLLRIIGPSLLALIAVACGGDTPDTGGPDTGAAVGGDRKDMAAADQQVFRVRITGEPKTIDPHLSNFSHEISIVKPLFSGLFTYDEEIKVVPAVAAQMPTLDNGGISRDGRTYTIKLRPDAKWSDGTPLTAHDFAYSMRRAMDPRLAGPYTSFYHIIKGAKAYNTALGTKDAPKTPADAELARMAEELGVRATDDRTLVYTLDEPYGSFLDILAIWTAFPVRKDIVEKHGSGWTEPANIVSNGPYVLKEWAHNQRLVLAPNPNWFGEQKATASVVINMMADDAAAFAAYQNNELDQVTVPVANRKEVMSSGHPLNKEVFRRPEAVVFALMMNNKMAPFDNQKVREAFGVGFDRKAFVEAALQGVGKPTTSWIAEGAHGYDADAGKHLEFNAAKAKQLLAEAGFPEGRGLPKVTFLVTSTDTNRNVVAPFVVENYKKHLGIDVEFEFVDTATYSSRYTRNEHQIALGGWHYDWNHANNWLPELLGTGGSNNHTNYSSPQFDDLMRRAAAEVDSKKQLDLYREGQRLALKDVGLAPIYEREVFLVIKPWVKDFTFTSLDGYVKGDYNFHRIYIAKY
jgi:oligopeptide transport system substrate-binding protein